MITNYDTIEMFDITRYFIASNMGFLMIIGMFFIASTKEDTKYNYLGIFLLFFAMGVFVVTGTPLDILLIGLEGSENLDFSKEYKIFRIFGFCTILFSLYYLYKFFKNNPQKMQ